MGDVLSSNDNRNEDSVPPPATVAQTDPNCFDKQLGTELGNAIDEGGNEGATRIVEYPVVENPVVEFEQTVIDQQSGSEIMDSGQTVDDNINLHDKVAGALDSEDAGATEIDTDIERTILQQWQDKCTDETTPELTIKSDPEWPRTQGFDFRLKPREISQEGEARGENPDYVRGKKLGEGGMGEVYAARQKSIDRNVAIKFLKSKGVRQESSLNAFIAEAIITGELDHPNIVPVYDLGLQDEKTPFYVMKQVQGVEWADRIRKLTLRENLDILIRVADAIALAHAREIIHRDLKPANVMLGEFGEVLVMDWGLATPAPDSDRGNRFPEARYGGTPCYMPPEMAIGAIENVDQRSDIYLLGAILFEILTGSTPHRRKTVRECLRAAAENEFVPTNETGLLMDIAMKAMSKSRDDRYQTVREFEAAVKEYFAHLESISLAEHGEEELKRARASNEYDDYARTVFAFEQAYELWPGNDAAKSGISAARLSYAESALEKGDHDLCGSVLDTDDPAHADLRLRLFEEVSEKRRHDEERSRRLKIIQRVSLALTAAVVTTVVVAFVWINSERTAALSAEQKARTAQQDEAIQRELAVAAEREARTQAVLADRARDTARRRVSRLHEATGMSLIHAGDDGAGLVHLAASLQEDISIIKSRRESAEAEERLYKAPDESLADRETASRIRLAGILNRLPRLLQLWSFGSQSAEFNHDGSRVLIMGGDGRARLLDVETGELVSDPFEHPGSGMRARLSPDGRRLVTCTRDKGAWLWDATTGQVVRKLAEAGLTAQAKFSPDGRMLITLTDYTAHLWDANSGKPLVDKVLSSHAYPIFDASFSPDSQLVAVAARGGPALRVLKVPAGTVVPGFETDGADQGSGVEHVHFSPDGNLMFGDGASRMWNVETGQPVFSRLEVMAQSTHFTPDGKSLVGGTRDGKTFVYDAASGRRLMNGPSHLENIVAAAVSPDGRSVATGGFNRILNIWSRRTGRLMWSPLHHAAAVDVLEFSPDGRRLLAMTSGGETRVWDLTTKPLMTNRIVHGAPVQIVRYLPTGGHQDRSGGAIVSASSDGIVKISDSRSGAAVIPPLDHGSPVKQISFNTDCLVGRGVQVPRDKQRSSSNEAQGVSRPAFDGRLVTVGESTTIWDAKTGTRFLGPIGPIGGQYPLKLAVMTPDSRQLIFSYAGSFNVFDVEARRDIHVSLQQSGSFIHYLRVSPDGRRVLTGSDNVVHVWDLKTGKVVFRFEKTTAMARWHPDGRLVVCSTGGHVTLLDPESGDPVDAFAIARPFGFKCSPDGRFLAARYRDGGARVWDIESHRPVTRSLRHEAAVLDIAFSPPHAADPTGGRHIVTASEDGTARVWDVQTGLELLMLRHAGPVRSAEFGPHGREVATACDDGSVRVWRIPAPVEHSPDHLTKMAQVLSSRVLDARLGLETIEPEQAEKTWNQLNPELNAGLDSESHRTHLVDAHLDDDWFAVAFHLDHLINAEPDDATLYRDRGIARSRLGQDKLAIEDFTRSAELNPMDVVSRFARGRAHARLEDFDLALQDFKWVTDQLESVNAVTPDKASQPRDVDLVDPIAPWLLLSIMHGQLEQSEPSSLALARVVDTLIRLRPEQSWSDRHNGMEQHEKLWKQIETELTASLDRESPPSWLWRARGLARAALGRWSIAAKDFEQATEQDADDPHAWHGLARALSETEPAPSAPPETRIAHAKRLVEVTDRLNEISPEDWSARRLQIRGLINSRQLKLALSDLAAAIDLADSSAELRLMRGRLRFQLRQFADSAEDLARATELDPANVQARYECAVAYAESEQWGIAAEHLRAVAMQVKVNPQLFYQLAVVSLAAGRDADYREACATLVRMAVQTGDSNLANTAAWACALAPNAVEDFTEITRLAKRAVSEKPKSYSLLNTYGAILVRSGRHLEAIEQLDAAIAAHGKGGTAVDWLFQAFARRGIDEAESAQSHIKKATEWIDEIKSGKRKSDLYSYPLSWRDKVEFRVLLNEARSTPVK